MEELTGNHLKPRLVDLQNILAGFVALIDDHRSALGNVVKAWENLDVFILNVERTLAFV